MFKKLLDLSLGLTLMGIWIWLILYSSRSGANKFDNNAWMIFWTALMTVATISMAVLAGIQLKAYKAALKGEEKAEERLQQHEEATRNFAHQELRAYGFVKPETDSQPITDFGSEKIIKSGLRVSFQLWFVNFGKTPAYDARIFLRMKIRASGKPPQPTMEEFIQVGDSAIESKRGIASIPSGERMRGNAHIQFKTVEDYLARVKQWEDKEISIFIYGAAIYRDAFHKYWKTDFLIEFANLSSTGPTLWPCENGNQENEINLKNLPGWWGPLGLPT